jgi:hypothetical protein
VGQFNPSADAGCAVKKPSRREQARFKFADWHKRKMAEADSVGPFGRVPALIPNDDPWHMPLIPMAVHPAAFAGHKAQP